MRRYGSSYLIDAINSLQQDEWARADPRDELKGYLSAPPEKTDQVLQWWGVRAFIPIDSSSINDGTVLLALCHLSDAAAHGARLFAHSRVLHCC